MIEHRQYKDLCVTFYYVADIALTNVESYKIVLARIIKVELAKRVIVSCSCRVSFVSCQIWVDLNMTHLTIISKY